MSTLELWIVLQIALDAVIVLLMIFFLVRLKRLGRGETREMPGDVTKAMEHFIHESEKLSESFSKTLQEKKDLSVSLLLKLERKITDMNRLLKEAEDGLSKVAFTSPAPETDKANPAAPENRAMVLRLADQGRSVEEIARQVRLHRGEVELILDLERKFKL